MKPCIALRIEAAGYGARHALPLLADLLRARNAGASFVFALGSDWLGRSLAQHCLGTLRQLRDACFDLGVYGWEPGLDPRRIARADAAWIAARIGRMRASFLRAFEAPPTLHAAPGWLSHAHALRLTQRLGFACASDTRGRHPFVPVWHGEIVRCPQIPVTLPTLDELATATNAASADPVATLLALTANPPPQGHVFSLNADRSQPKSTHAIERLLAGWGEQGYALVSVQALASRFALDDLPRHEIVTGRTPGRRDAVLLQGDEFLSTWRKPT
jgi:peptidoglycan/xylan/chitin deacetylase (PgdA/CDA1 family)